MIRVPSIGDPIHEGDILTTGGGTEIQLEFYDGIKLEVGENTEILLDESVYAGLNPYPDARADQLAELQSLIVEGIDLDELEATDAGPTTDSDDALHQVSTYAHGSARDIVDTRDTPLAFDDSGSSSLPMADEDGILLESQADTGSPSTSIPPDAGPLPIASISVNAITADDMIDASEADTTINGGRRRRRPWRHGQFRHQRYDLQHDRRSR
ncbi:MAG: hypothetical protein EP300_09310 [Gammaproteobacteria bacterium]|nr:MAG: hypothetical protein EP300_09310 [Gammaproteobacteria bacterium]